MTAAPRIAAFSALLFVGICLWAMALLIVAGCSGHDPKVIAAKYQAEQLACIAAADDIQGLSNEEKLLFSRDCRLRVMIKYGRIDGGKQ